MFATTCECGVLRPNTSAHTEAVSFATQEPPRAKLYLGPMSEEV
jgi:hypothetical protein